MAILEPTREFLSQSPQQFIESLVAEHHPIAIIEGPDFRFGKGRKGDIALLRTMGAQMGFEVQIQPAVEVTLSNHLAVPVSSSLVRWLVGHGRMLDAAICLDEPHVLTAPVVSGERRGREIGVPTVNLDNHALGEHLIPPDGVYAGTVEIHPDHTREPSHRIETTRHAAAISIGAKPTFGQSPVTIEAHLLDFDGDLYGRTVSLRFARWLRAQCWFPGVESLKDQIARDIARTRWYNQHELLDPPRRPVAARQAG